MKKKELQKILTPAQGDGTLITEDGYRRYWGARK